MKKTIIFDNEWVIVRNDWDYVAKIISKELDTPLLSGDELKQSFRLYDKTKSNPNGDENNPLYLCNKGLIEPDELWSQVLQSSTYKLEPNVKNISIMADAMSQLTTNVDIETVKLISKLNKEDYRLFMLSNSTPDIYRGNSERYNYFDDFERCYFSFDIGFRKPDRRSYLEVLNENMLNPKNCLFIDDKEENLVGAEKLGITPIYHKIDEGKKLEDRIKNYL